MRYVPWLTGVLLGVAIQAVEATPTVLSAHANQETLTAGWSAQLAQPEAIQIREVQLSETDTGLVIRLVTNGQSVVPVTSAIGNALILDISNAVLELLEDEFSQASPIEGIALVSVSALPDNRVRVAITGVQGAPTVEASVTEREILITATPVFGVEEQANGELDPDAGPQRIQLIVSAEKTPEVAQEVPISLTVLPEQVVEDANITSLAEVAANTPNFSASAFGGDSRYFLNYSIRGLGNSNFLSRDAVGVYIDDVPYSYGSFLTGDLIDVEQIEVLRGPQSTLYGRTAQAGVVNITTRSPSSSGRTS